MLQIFGVSLDAISIAGGSGADLDRVLHAARDADQDRASHSVELTNLVGFHAAASCSRVSYSIEQILAANFRGRSWQPWITKFAVQELSPGAPWLLQGAISGLLARQRTHALRVRHDDAWAVFRGHRKVLTEVTS